MSRKVYIVASNLKIKFIFDLENVFEFFTSDN